MIGADKLMPGKFYHIYNRTNGSETLFRNSGDRKFFLKNVIRYLSPIMEVYAYCLMRNHFHLLVKIADKNKLEQIKLSHYSSKFNCFDGKQVELLKKVFDFPDNHHFISQQFSNMFDSYSKSFNNKHKRDGNLFHKSFHRKIVRENDYLRYLFFYIHLNPIRDFPDKDFYDPCWSSFHDIISGNRKYVNIKFAEDFFGDLKHFESYHLEMLKYVRGRNNWLELTGLKSMTLRG